MRKLLILLLLLISAPCCAAVDLNGDADSINIGSGTSIDQLGPVTIYAVVNLDTIDSTARYIFGSSDASNNPRIALFVESSNTVRLAVLGSNSLDRVGAGGSMPTGTTTTVICTWDGSGTATNSHIYVNGSEITYATSGDGSGFNDDSGGNKTIGNRNDLARPLNGKIYVFALWNSVLSSTSISMLSNSGDIRLPLQIEPANLVAYYPLDDFSGGTALSTAAGGYKDLSGNGNNGQGVDANGNSLNVSEDVLSYQDFVQYVNVSTTTPPAGGGWVWIIED